MWTCFYILTIMEETKLELVTLGLSFWDSHGQYAIQADADCGSPYSLVALRALGKFAFCCCSALVLRN